MGTLLRLAGWGVAATAAIAVAVAAAYTDGGQQRLQMAAAALTGKSQVAKAEAPNPTPVPAPAARAAPDPVQLARLAATENETRRLMEVVRAVEDDRERLLTRLAAVERNLEDVTGSIRKQGTLSPAPEPQASPAPVLAGPPATTPPPQDTEVPTAQAPAAPPEQLASLVPPAESNALDATPQQPAAGVDVGGAANFDGLRTLWNATKAINPSLFEGLRPVVGVRENSKTRAADLRLIVGPLADLDAVTKICAALAGGMRACQPAAFEGQPLAVDVPALPRRAKAPERKAALPAAPPSPAPAFQDR